VELVETLLPGVGVRYDLRTRSGNLLGLVLQRDGAVEVAVYDRRDPDRARGVLKLDADEAEAVAELLGAPRVAQRFADLSREVPGLRSARLSIAAGSAFDGRTLGDTRARTRTGCSVVALVRDQQVVASPAPDQPLQAGDVLVVIGAEQGLERLAALLSTGG
jgi:TrkA domain protein